MQSGRKFASFLGTVALLLYFAAAGPAQDLGEVARQQKLKKAASPSPERHVITNEDIPSAKASTAAASPQKPGKGRADPAAKTSASKPETQEDSKPSAEDVRETIRAQKQNVASAEAELKAVEREWEELRGALSRADGDCLRVFIKGTAWQNVCDLPAKLTAEKSRLKGRIEQERKILEEMQEEARRMGYGNTVYEPD